MAPHLIRMEGDVQGKAYPIDKARMTFGRAEDSTIVLQSKFASRLHAELHYADGIYTLYIPDGKQVAVNGQPAAGQIRLTPEDVIDFPEERFTFGEIKKSYGGGTKKAEAAKADPVRIAMFVLVLLVGGPLAYDALFPKQFAERPADQVSYDINSLSPLLEKSASLKEIKKDIFWRGDYGTALMRLDNEVGAAVSAEEREKIREAIFGLIRVDLLNQFVNGKDHFRTQQLEAARANYNAMVRMEHIFVQSAGRSKPLEVKLPTHPRLIDANNKLIELTAAQAIAEAKLNIIDIDAILEGREPPSQTAGKKPAG